MALYQYRAFCQLQVNFELCSFPAGAFGQIVLLSAYTFYSRCLLPRPPLYHHVCQANCNCLLV